MSQRPDFQLRTAGLTDVTELAAIVLAASRGQLSSDEDWDAPKAEIRLAEDIARERAPTADAGGDTAQWTTSVVEVGGAPVGRLQVMRGIARIELCGMQLHPDAQGLSIGTAWAATRSPTAATKYACVGIGDMTRRSS